MKQYKLSIIIIVYNLERFKQTIQSILKQTYLKRKIELILVDEVLDKETSDYINSLKTLNCISYKSKSHTLAEYYNEALQLAHGEYITFIDSNYFYEEKNLLAKVIDKLNNRDIVSINAGYFDSDTLIRKKYKMQPHNGSIIDLKEYSYDLNLLLESYFFPYKLIENIKFNRTLGSECRIKFLLDVLRDNTIYEFVNNFHITSVEPWEDNTSKGSLQYDKSWYIPSMRKFVLPYLQSFKGPVPKYIEEALMYVIYAKYNANIYDRNKGVISEKEFKEFSNMVTRALLLISDRTIIQPSNIGDDEELGRHLFKIQRWLKYELFYNKLQRLKVTSQIKIGKYNNEEKIICQYQLGSKKVVNEIGYTYNETINIFAINYRQGKLFFDCTTSLRDYMAPEDIQLEIHYNKQKIAYEETQCYTLLKAFGKTMSHKYAFRFSIDALPLKSNILEIYAYIGHKKIKLNFHYAKVGARLANVYNSYWHYRNFMMINKNDQIIIKEYHRFNVLPAEIKFFISEFKTRKNKLRVLKLAGLRFIYYLTHWYYKKKHIWLTWDKLYKAGDNGEYMYHYCLKQKKNIYYIIKKDSLDYPRLKKANRQHIIVYNSLKAKLFSLQAEAILKTHANVISYCGFEGLAKDFAAGLFNAEILEIQHGLTIQDIAQYQNRLFDNIKHYFCASQLEVNNILKKIYDFAESDISLTGLARYDGLKPKNQKIVLITPTWRRNVVNSSVAHIKKKHNDNFKNSDYFKIYDSLINNERLIATAKKCGYKIVFLLHPAMSAQLEDYDQNDYVKIIPATGNVNYEKILTESSLMVTDYSGVQYDFAYQRKVLVYYHPAALPPHYEAGGINYDTQGFGPVCKNEKDLVDTLCYYIENNCHIDERYKERADKFFAFSDYHNCARILAGIEEYLTNNKE